MKQTWAGLVALLATLGALFFALPFESTPARAQDVDRIEVAVKKGVAYLKSATWQFMDVGGNEQTDLGVAALCGMALLESDMPKQDPGVQKAYATVKRGCESCTQTYPLSLCIMFLSRYGAQGGDQAVVKKLCLRLMAAQATNGGWGYSTPLINENQEREWDKYFRDREKLTKVEKTNENPFAGGVQGPDNSNTQFGILALWLGRKSGVPVKYALLRCEDRFRKAQAQDGSWGYGVALGADRAGAGMTCAGLLALAVGHGNTLERQARFQAGGAGDAKDAKPAAPAGGLTLDELQSDAAVLRARSSVENFIRTGNMEHFLYFLWSLERVCMVFGWDKDNWWDWYGWGSEALLKSQKQDGSWSYEYGRAVDTSFALLFLRRANLLGDLTKKAKFTSTDPARAIGGKAGTPPKDAPPPAKEASDGLPNSAEELGKELITSQGQRRNLIIIKLRDTTGKEFTTALATGIPQLSGTDQRLARDALAKRLERLTAKSLVGYMEDTDKELQLAGARASAKKEKANAKELAPPLVTLLDSFDDDIKEAAYESLKALSGEDFGRSAASWKAWWTKTFG